MKDTNKSLRSILCNVERIYCINGFPDIRFFLSVYDPTKRSVLIVPSLIAQCPVLTAIIERERIITVPNSLNIELPLGPRLEWPRMLWPFFQTALRLRILFRYFPLHAEAYIFNDFNAFPAFLLAARMRKKGQKLSRIDVFPWLITDTNVSRAIFPEDKRWLRFISLLGLFAGTELVEAIYRPIDRNDDNFEEAMKNSAIGYGLASPVESLEPDLRSWAEIAAKYNLPRFSSSEPAVLLVDTPFSAYWKGVDEQETYRRVITYLDKTLPSGTAIHVKCHYREQENSILRDIHIRRRVCFLDPTVPSELFLHYYGDAYFFISSSALEPSSCRKHSLLPLMAFYTESEKKRFRTYQLSVFGAAAAEIPDVSL